MKRIVLAAGALLALGVISGAEAKTGGCLKYGLGGAVAGHFAGHGMAGAAAGCAVGAYRRHQANERARSTHPDTTGSVGRATGAGPQNNRY